MSAAVEPAPSQELLAFVRQVASMTKDGELEDGKEFVMENDDAVTTLHSLISGARELLEGLR
jgi:hypothetical protein